MNVSVQPPPAHAAAIPSLGSVLQTIAGHRGVQTAVGLLVVAYVVVLKLARGSLPFDRPAVAHLSFASQMAVPPSG
jgi:hypothetical protein